MTSCTSYDSARGGNERDSDSIIVDSVDGRPAVENSGDRPAPYRETLVTVDESTVSLELYVESLAPVGPQRRLEGILGRLRRLDDCDSVTTEVVWGDRLRLGGAAAATQQGQAIQLTVEQFEQWACDNEASLHPFFQRRDVDPLVGDPYTVLTFPTMCLAVSVDGMLRRVVPCRQGGQTYGVGEFLETFEPPVEQDADARASATSAIFLE